MLKIYGFDFTDPANIGWTGGTFVRETSTVRNGTHSYKGSGIASATSPNFGNLATVYAGVAVNWQSIGTMNKCIAFIDNSTIQICVTIETTGALKIRRGDETGTVLASSSTGIFTANTWHHIQLYLLCSSSTSGAVELRLNGTTVASASGLITSNSGNSYANKFALYGCPGFNYGYYDDCWISDTTWQGDCKVETIYPSANGTTNNFTASGAASQYQCVDETGDYNSDTDYTYSPNAGDKDLYAMGNLASVTGTIKGVNINAVIRKDDTGTRTAAMVIRNAGVESVRTTNTLTTSYVVYSEALTQDPTDSTTWTIAKVNAMELGVKVIA